MITEFKRVKFGALPGDFAIFRKIMMREKKVPFSIHYGGDHYQYVSRKSAKVYRRYLIDKSRTVQRRRDKEAIHAQSDD